MVSPGFPFSDAHKVRVTASIKESTIKQLDKIIKGDARLKDRSNAIEFILEKVLYKEEELLINQARFYAQQLHIVQTKLKDIREAKAEEENLMP